MTTILSILMIAPMNAKMRNAEMASSGKMELETKLAMMETIRIKMIALISAWWQLVEITLFGISRAVLNSAMIAI